MFLIALANIIERFFFVLVAVEVVICIDAAIALLNITRKIQSLVHVVIKKEIQCKTYTDHMTNTAKSMSF